ncbi:uncharacterized protein Z519_00743 [Cladophialophora bantiana CBS 173.52]|uniref:Fibroin-3 related protein n=1 Tax=Cladophialophora bantiana (strain ATCC 10958 / CBS 173.52 / CDC B-1940 / NIH 8579) TaxID=1442370 RepID=A0A0D2I745_CLAB1|nr:uncharacterized protein Z519_00743 [Cladophialophora bantiana CBS 173.52]KIW99080.1 hypothetical protein Z519_00743 [Cladophialophora bantiana CBS 173.52]
MAHYIYARDVVSDVKSVPDTFSSWDKCMQKSYCKWPVIAAIVIGSLILLSVLFCIARCICCGAEICSCCMSCCGGCCRGGRSRDRPSKYKDDYTRMPPTPYQGYQPAPSPMAYGGVNPSVPQFATFDDPSTKRMINEDALPPMPSWDTATKRRVEDTSEPPQQTANGDLEMGRLDSQPQRMRGGYNSVPNRPMSPVSQNSQANYQNNFQPIPLSPPPTYHSNSFAPSVASNSDKFVAGAASPSPYEYSRGQQHQPGYHNAYAPSNTVSTLYEPPQNDYSSHRISMPKPYNPVSSPPPQAPYPDSASSPYEARPPSFLQVGRKPVSGSMREV